MPPKQKKEKAKKTLIPLDDIDTTILTKDKLQEFCINVQDALIKESQYSNFLILDRDKLTNMVAIARENLVRVKSGIRAKEYELEDAESSHRSLMGERRQKLINLASDKNIESLHSKLESVKFVNREKQCHEGRVLEITSDIKKLKKTIYDQEKAFSKEITKREIKHAEDKYEIRQNDNNMQMAMESKREKIISNKTKELSHEFEQAYQYLENKKNMETKELIKNHNKLTNDLVHYFNKIIRHNMNVMNEMKTRLQELKSETATVDLRFSRLKQENKFLKRSLAETRIEEKNLTEKLASSKRDKTELKLTKRDLTNESNILDRITWELEILKIMSEKQDEYIAEEESKQLSRLFTSLTRAADLMLVLEYIVQHLYNKLAETDSTLYQIRSIYSQRGESLETLPTLPDMSLDECTYQLAVVAQKRDHVLARYSQLLNKYHVHPDNTGFQPLQVEDILQGAVQLRVLVDEE